jgi:glutamyl/glutaminyl-tRNA synthetase
MQLCTLEFETRRASYYWLLHALGIYQPYVWEYSRLNISNTVMSKRKVRQQIWMLYYYVSLYRTVPVPYFELFFIEA